VVENIPTLSATEMQPKKSCFSDVSLKAIFAEVTNNECVMHRRSHTSLLPLLRHNLLIIIFKFNCKSDFTMIFFCKLPLGWKVSNVFCSTCTMSS